MADDEIEQRDHAHEYWRTPVQVATVLAALDPAHVDQEFARFADYIPTLCWLARGDGFISWYNQRWHDYCGTTPAEMEGWGWQDVHDPAHLPSVLERWTQAISKSEPFEMEFPLRGSDGAFRPFLTRVIPIYDADGHVARWYGVNTEIGAQVTAERALLASEANFAALTDAMPQMIWATNADGHHNYYNAQWYAFTGVSVGSTEGEDWNELFHPDDRDLVWNRWRESLAEVKPYEVEYRLRHHSGEYRWTLCRAVPVMDIDGQVSRWIGTCTDIDAAKRAADQNELLSRELSHRIKNIFAVIAGLISLTARKSKQLEPIATELLARIGALGRAHEFARPHSPESAQKIASGSLRGIIKEILAPYDHVSKQRITISGDEVRVDDRGATPMALVIHELATNSAKYGALSVDQGSVEVAIERSDDAVMVRWMETAGPTVAGPPVSTGFGSDLARLSVERQLGGKIAYDWDPAGLRVSIEVRASRLHR